MTEAESATAPPTRWELTTTGERWEFYKDRFATMFADGSDMDGEARFVDAMAPRGAAVLDAGCGTGRVAAALQRRGHRAIGSDRDAGLVAVARERYADVSYVVADNLELTSELLVEAGGPGAFDVIVLAGNVMVYLAPGTERRVLAGLSGLLVPNGRIVAGFATDRDYSLAQFDADADAVGLKMESRFATWHLDPFEPESDWAVTVLRGKSGDDDQQKSVDSAHQWGPSSSWPAAGGVAG